MFNSAAAIAYEDFIVKAPWSKSQRPVKADWNLDNFEPSFILHALRWCQGHESALKEDFIYDEKTVSGLRPGRNGSGADVSRGVTRLDVLGRRATPAMNEPS